MILAPIILFIYNRPWHTQQTVEALRRNELANNSVLFVFADGAKSDATEEHLENMKKTREYIHQISGFKEVYIEEADENKGLAKSVVEGVTKVINRFGKVIVLEDDIVTSSGFLKYMNEALTLYEDEPKVMHIAGYMYPLKKNMLPNTFFYPAASCWGWATWKRAWENYNSDAAFLYENIKKKKLTRLLNINKIHDFEGQLKANIKGELNTWFIKWNASVILNGGYALYPKYSLVQNVGFDGSGEHCGNSNLFYCPQLIESVEVKKQKLRYNKRAVIALKVFGFKKHKPLRFVKRSLKRFLGLFFKTKY